MQARIQRVKTRTLDEVDLQHLRELHLLLQGLRGARSLAARPDPAELPRLYRHACTVLARLEARGDDPVLQAEVRRLVGEAHGLQYRAAERRGPGATAAAALHFLAHEMPRTIRREWRLLALSFGLVYGLALLSYAAVRNDLDLAPTLLNPAMVEAEIEQLQETAEGEPFRGNFTFGLGQSPQTAGWIMLHNMGVGVAFFVSALFPPLYLLLLATNGLMLGTYTAVAGHWGQAGAISSILWCHGVLEIQAICLAGCAGLALVRGWIRPGPWSRSHALRLESQTAWRLLAPVFPMLFAAGLIEGFVSPHAPLAVRLATAISTGLMLLVWAFAGGRRQAARAAAPG
jgi:uncharacterized membrane protein SpoIIM required for sporulation